MKPLLALLALACCALAHAEGMHKCKNAAGKITYTSQECKQLGLVDAGEVTGKISVTPAVQQNYPKWDKPAPPPPAEKAEAPKEPERRCFSSKNAKGGSSSTRCNDTPEEPDK